MSELTNAIKTICDEKGLSYDAVIATIEQALAAAYRKDFGSKNQNIKVEFDPETASSRVFDLKTVVEDLPEEELEDVVEQAVEEAPKSKNKDGNNEDEKSAKSSLGAADESLTHDSEEEVKKFNPRTDMQISDAKMIKKSVKVGDELKMELEVPTEYGRMAAQTAKQVIIQRLREAEREMVLNEFKDKEKEVVTGIIQRREGRLVLVDLGKAVGILPMEEQVRTENYMPGERIKVYIKEVRSSSRGPEIVLSRTSDEILKKIFYLEIPEISNGLVELKGVAREAGARSKVSVHTEEENVDPIGSCVGQKGARIQTIIRELGGEKVDIIEYSEDPKKYIANALSPAKVTLIETNDQEKKAIVKVANDQLSLAIGKGGQNARLAASLTGWKIDIMAADSDEVEVSVDADGEDAKEKKSSDAEAMDDKPTEVKAKSKKASKKKEDNDGE